MRGRAHDCSSGVGSDNGGLSGLPFWAETAVERARAAAPSARAHWSLLTQHRWCTYTQPARRHSAAGASAWPAAAAAVAAARQPGTAKQQTAREDSSSIEEAAAATANERGKRQQHPAAITSQPTSRLVLTKWLVSLGTSGRLSQRPTISNAQ